MHEGDMFVFSDHIRVETNGAGAKKGYEDGWDSVQGCQPHPREPASLRVQWVAPQQMAQLAPGQRWCGCCGDVRPLSYFDVLEYDTDGKPVKYADECRQCINSRDPKLAKEKFCSACKVMHRRDEFADDDDYLDGKYPSCYTSEARRKTAARARRAWLEEGRVLRQWQRVGA